MIRLINDYLLQHKSVSIPGLGTIYVERIPAQSDYINKQLIPPAYHYRFDKYFDAPGRDFFIYLSAKKRMPEHEAIKLYNEWALGIRNAIGTENSVNLEGIGLLKRAGSGEIMFEPAGPLKTCDIAVPAERVIRIDAKHTMLVGDKQTTTVEMSGYLQETPQRKTSWWIYALIIAAAALLAIGFHYYHNGSEAPFGNHQPINTR